MRVTLNIPDYNVYSGVIQLESAEARIESDIADDGEVVLAANKAGLEVLAINLLTLANDQVPLYRSMRYGEFNVLKEGMTRFRFTKIADGEE